MEFDTLEAVLLAIGFLVPGFVWSSVLSILVPRRARATEIRFLEFLTLSCVNHGLWFWALWLIFATGFSIAHPNWTALCLFAIIFISPIAFGIRCGRLQQRNAVKRLLARLGFRTISSIPTAWDWYFVKGVPCWVVVTLKNGSRVAGFFGTSSFAGDDPNERDLYLEAQFRLAGKGRWKPVANSAGVLIKADQIALLDFRKIGDTRDDRQTK